MRSVFVLVMICCCAKAFATSTESELEQFVRISVVAGYATANELDQFELSQLRNLRLSDSDAVLALQRIVSSGEAYCQREQDYDYEQLPSSPTKKFKSPLKIEIQNGTISVDPFGKKLKLRLDF